MTMLITYAHLVASDLFTELVIWLPIATLILKFLSAFLGFALSLALVGTRVRRWLRLRSRRR